MLRFLIGLCLLPFAIYGVIIALWTVTRIVDAFNHRAPLPHLGAPHAGAR